MGNSLCGTHRGNASAARDTNLKNVMATFLKLFIMLNYLFLMYYIFSILYCFMKRYVCSQFGSSGKCCKAFSEYSQTVSGSYRSNQSECNSAEQSTESQIGSPSDEFAECQSTDSMKGVTQTPPKRTVACQSPCNDLFPKSPVELVQMPCVKAPQNMTCQERTPTRPSLYDRTKQWRSLFTCPWSERLRQRFYGLLSVPRTLLNCPEQTESYYQGGSCRSSEEDMYIPPDCRPPEYCRPMDKSYSRRSDCRPSSPKREAPERTRRCSKRGRREITFPEFDPSLQKPQRDCPQPIPTRDYSEQRPACDYSKQKPACDYLEQRPTRDCLEQRPACYYSEQRPTRDCLEQRPQRSLRRASSSLENIRVEFNVVSRPVPPVSGQTCVRPPSRSKARRRVECCPQQMHVRMGKCRKRLPVRC